MNAQIPYQLNPYQQQFPNPYQPMRQQLIRVTGIDGARAYQMAPNSVVPLFDANEDVLYVKSTDGAGFPTIRSFSFAPIEDAAPQQPQFVTRQELDEAMRGLREAMGNGKQPVRQHGSGKAQ